MDKKFIVLVLVALILIIFQGKIKAHLTTLNSIQKLMMGQIVILGGILVILLYYILSRSEEE